MTDDRHEARLLLAVAREDWEAARDLVRARAPDPEIFVGLCRAGDVGPWVHARLASGDRFDLVGEKAEASLETARRKCRNDNILLLARLEQALDLLLAADIVPVALKGIDFVHRFHEGFDERTLDDVDLLVPPERAAQAVAVLEAAGWTAPPEPERTHWLRSSFELPLRSPGPVPVLFEIHWSLGQHRRYRVEARELLERAPPLTVAGRAVRRLEDHDAAAHLLIHHLQHYFDRRLKWAIDLARLVRSPEFRWPVVAARLDAWGGRPAAALALVHLAKLLPDIASEDARRCLNPERWRRLVTWPLRSSHPLDLYRGTERRWVQLWIAAALLERPSELPGYLLHRARRDVAPGVSPLEPTRGGRG